MHGFKILTYVSLYWLIRSSTLVTGLQIYLLIDKWFHDKHGRGITSSYLLLSNKANFRWTYTPKIDWIAKLSIQVIINKLSIDMVTSETSNFCFMYIP